MYELRRIRSVRATWIVSALYLASVVAFGALPLYLGSHEVGSAFIQSWKGLYNTPANFFSVVLLSVIAAQSFGHEYRYGTIRLTLSEFPKRERVLIAKTLVLAVYVVVMHFVAWSALGLVGKFAPSGSLNAGAEGFTFNGGAPADLWKVLVYGLAYCLIAFSVAAITRNLALGIVIPLVFASVLEGLINGISTLVHDRLRWLVDILPISNGQSWLSASKELPHAGLVFSIWVVGLLMIATFMFARRDA